MICIFGTYVTSDSLIQNLYNVVVKPRAYQLEVGRWGCGGGGYGNYVIYVNYAINNSDNT